MKLVHISTVPQSLGFFRGQAAYMRRRGFEVHAISAGGPVLDEFAAREQVIAHAIPMRRVIAPLADLAALARLCLLLRRIRPDIVHACTPKAGLLGMMAAALTGVPARIFHNLGLPHQTATGLRRFLLFWSTRISCALAHRVLCVSPSMLDLSAAERLCPRWKLAVPGHGSVDGVDAAGRFNPETCQPARAEARQRHGIPADALVVGFLGRIVRDKGVVELVAAWQMLKREFSNLHLLAVGEFESEDPLPPDVEHLLRADPDIHLTGWSGETPALLNAMDVLVVPTYREGFGIALIEAAAMSIPVVSSRIPGCWDAVEDGVTGMLVPPHDVEALVREIRNYLSDPARRQVHGGTGRVRALRDFTPAVVRQAVHDEYVGLAAPRIGWGSLLAKRLVDFAVAAAGLLLLSPVLALVALAIRLSLGRPVLFRQVRPGHRERPITVTKFRTMTGARDGSGALLPDARRLTALGSFLRRTSLDELPQLWSVLTGEMSLVGPRPLLPQYLARYTAEQRRRHLVKPGISGWAQVRGRNALAWEEKFGLDLWYVDHWSFWLDLKILALTAAAVVRPRGISLAGHATMPEFTGAGGRQT